jgi:hypothetical protein
MAAAAAFNTRRRRPRRRRRHGTGFASNNDNLSSSIGDDFDLRQIKCETVEGTFTMFFPRMVNLAVRCIHFLARKFLETATEWVVSRNNQSRHFIHRLIPCTLPHSSSLLLAMLQSTPPTTTTTTMTCPVERGIFLSLFPLSGGGARFFLILFSYGGRRRSRRKPRAATATRMSVHSRRPVWSDVASCREESGVKSVLLNKAAENRSCAARM